jgi:hypothetical protein
LIVPPGRPLIAFCTDPTIERVLTQDFHAAQRAARADDQSVITITVNTNQQFLKPGVSLAQIAPGAPEVAALLKAAGATPPPLGDTGAETNQAAVARAQAEQRMLPADNPMQSLMNAFKTEGDLGPEAPCEPGNPSGPGCPEATPKPQPGDSNYRGDVDEYTHREDPASRFHPPADSAVYDTVLVARASASNSPEEMTVVAVIHPGEDLEEAKQLVAEEIANAILH